MTQHIGIVRLSAIGDVVLVSPIIELLQQHFEDVKITWIIGRAAYSLLKGLKGCEFIVIDKPKGIRDYLAFRKRMQHLQFDVLLAMQASFRANLLYPLINAKRKIGFDRKRAKDLHRFFINETISPGEEHLLDGFLKFAHHIGVSPDKEIKWQLPIDENACLWADEHLPKGDIVLVNPVASKAERHWPKERYQKLITEMTARHNVKCVLTGGPNDVAFCDYLQQSTGSLNLAGKTNLKQLAAVIKKANVLIAPDTGPVHIANALGTKVIGLYAVAPSALSGPYSSRQWVIDKYDEAVRQFLNKKVSEVRFGERVHTACAMNLITIDEVLNKLSQALPA